MYIIYTCPHHWMKRFFLFIFEYRVEYVHWLSPPLWIKLGLYSAVTTDMRLEYFQIIFLFIFFLRKCSYLCFSLIFLLEKRNIFFNKIWTRHRCGWIKVLNCEEYNNKKEKNFPVYYKRQNGFWGCINLFYKLFEKPFHPSMSILKCAMQLLLSL